VSHACPLCTIPHLNLRACDGPPEGERQVRKPVLCTNTLFCLWAEGL
jgi:hypothetical protein